MPNIFCKKKLASRADVNSADVRLDKPLKLLIFAATPPPHHGQSYAVQALISGLRDKSLNQDGTYPQLEIYHVNSRFSDDLETVGQVNLRKVLRLFPYCFQAIWHRFRHGVTNFYYVPAPGTITPIRRDWLVMLLCRPFFKRIIFHWHAAGMGEWLEKEAKPWERAVTFFLLGRHELSVTLGEFNRADALKLAPRQCCVIPNGIQDPCPDFETTLRPQRIARISARQSLLNSRQITPNATSITRSSPRVFQILFLSLCTREKGVFDILEAVELLNAQLRSENAPIRARLNIAGSFRSAKEREEFEQRARELGLRFVPANEAKESDVDAVAYHGFVSGEAKRRLFEDSDVFCFPTFYSAESFGLVLLEAMAYGLPIITTQWRSIPDLLPKDYAGIVPPRQPKDLARALNTVLHAKDLPDLRSRFLERFTSHHFIQNMRKALVSAIGNNSQKTLPGLSKAQEEEQYRIEVRLRRKPSLKKEVGTLAGSPVSTSC